MPPYLPDNTHISLQTLHYLHSPAAQPLLAQVAVALQNSPTLPVSVIAALRKSFPADALHAALVLHKLQPKAQQKFPHNPSPFWALPESLEQATDSAVAAHKASRFAALTPAHIYDLCAGIGGDTLALANIAPTTAIDLSPERLACLRYNLESQPSKHPVTTLPADITTFPFPASPTSLFHIDPARRNAGARTHLYADLIPGPPTLEKLIAHFPGGAIKLSSAVDFESLPPGHLELLSHNKTVVQAVLYVGTLAALFPPNTRTATLFSNHTLLASYTAPLLPPAHPEIPPLPGLTGYLLEADGGLTRSTLAHTLAHEHSLTPLTPDAGYLLAKTLPPTTTPILATLAPFAIHAAIPFSEKRVLEALRALPPGPPGPPGPIEVKTRGKLPSVDTDRLQPLFSKASPTRLTILIFRHQNTPIAVIASRIQ